MNTEGYTKLLLLQDRTSNKDGEGRMLGKGSGALSSPHISELKVRGTETPEESVKH